MVMRPSVRAGAAGITGWMSMAKTFQTSEIRPRNSSSA